jgi:hypothetical protein
MILLERATNFQVYLIGGAGYVLNDIILNVSYTKSCCVNLVSKVAYVSMAQSICGVKEWIVHAVK